VLTVIKTLVTEGEKLTCMSYSQTSPEIIWGSTCGYEYCPM